MSATIEIVDNKSSQKKNDPKYPLTPMEEKKSSIKKQLKATTFSHINIWSVFF